MKPLLAAVLPSLALAGVGLLRPAQDPATEAEAVAAAGELFQQRCITCHQPPDLELATDRAWLAQVKDTA